MGGDGDDEDESSRRDQGDKAEMVAGIHGSRLSLAYIICIFSHTHISVNLSPYI